MARPSYTSIPAGDVDLDTALESDTLRTLRPNSDHARLHLVTLHDHPATVATQYSGGTWLPGVQSFRVWIPDLPDYSGGGLSRLLWGQCHFGRVFGETSGLFEVRIHDVGSTTYSTTDSTAVNVAGAFPPIPPDTGILTLTVPDSWAGTVRTLEAQARCTGGCASGWLRFYNEPWVLEY